MEDQSVTPPEILASASVAEIHRSLKQLAHSNPEFRRFSYLIVMEHLNQLFQLLPTCDGIQLNDDIVIRRDHSAPPPAQPNFVRLDQIPQSLTS